jgi:hypothetical protein
VGTPSLFGDDCEVKRRHSWRILKI